MGDAKALFSTATSPKCIVGLYSFPWIATLYPVLKCMLDIVVTILLIYIYTPFFPLIFDSHLIMLNVKQGGIKYHLLCLRQYSTWDWTPVSWTIDEHSNHYANGPVQRIYSSPKISSHQIGIYANLILRYRGVVVIILFKVSDCLVMNNSQ